jgi:hypothetical protein
MTPNEELDNTPRQVAANVAPNLNSRLAGIQAASVICLLAGIWFFVSPWVYGAAAHGNAWNSWIVGAAIFLIGCLRVSRPAYSTGFSWVNLVLGIWAFFSPWIYAYTANSGRFINSLCVGVIVFVCALSSGVVATRIRRVPGPRP